MQLIDGISQKGAMKHSHEALRRISSMKQSTQNARNHYSRSHGNVGELHRRNK